VGSNDFSGLFISVVDEFSDGLGTRRISWMDEWMQGLIAMEWEYGIEHSVRSFIINQ